MILHASRGAARDVRHFRLRLLGRKRLPTHWKQRVGIEHIAEVSRRNGVVQAAEPEPHFLAQFPLLVVVGVVAGGGADHGADA